MQELEQIYRKRKQQLIPLIFGFASFFVLVRVVMPQWTDIVDTQNLILEKTQAVESKKATIQVLSAQSLENVTEDYDLVTTALPLQKDIVLIFEELNNVSKKTGVDLGGFSVKVGGVYASADNKKVSDKAVVGIPYLNIVIGVNGQNEGVRAFAGELYKSIPLVEIKSIDISKDSARYDVNFFYKPVVARPENADSVALEPLTAPEKNQLETLRSWKTSSF